MKRLTLGSLIPGKETGSVKPRRNERSGTGIPHLFISETDTPWKKSVRLIQNNKTYIIRPVKGLTLLDSALAENVPIDYKCKKGSCGRCKVAVLSGSELLSIPNEQEKQKLSGLENEGFRLACQSLVIK